MATPCRGSVFKDWFAGLSWVTWTLLADLSFSPCPTESVEAHQRSYDLGIQIGYQRRNKDVLAWVKKRRRTIRREDLISFLCGKAPPPRTSKAPPKLTVMSPNRAPSTETSSSVETDLQPFREAIALHGMSPLVYRCRALVGNVGDCGVLHLGSTL